MQKFKFENSETGDLVVVYAGSPEEAAQKLQAGAYEPAGLKDQALHSTGVSAALSGNPIRRMQNTMASGLAALEAGVFDPPPVDATGETGETTIGGMGRSLAAGGVRGALDVPEMVGTAARWAHEKGATPFMPSNVAGLLPLGEFIEDYARRASEKVSDLILGEEAGDTFLERAAGSVGEIAGATLAGGGAVRPLAAGRAALASARQSGSGRLAQLAMATAPARIQGARATMPMVGGGLGLEAGREAELGPAGQVGMLLLGTLAGKGVNVGGQSSVRLGGAIKNFLKDPGPEELDYVTRSVNAKKDALRVTEKYLGDVYDEIELSMRQSGVGLNTRPLKARFQQLWDSMDEVERGGDLTKFFNRIFGMDDVIDLASLRRIQRSVNESISTVKKSGGSSAFGLRGMRNAIRDSIDDVAKEGISGAPRSLRADLSQKLLDVNRGWYAAQRARKMMNFQTKMHDDILAFRGKYKRLTPIKFAKQLRDKDDEFIDLFSDELGVDGAVDHLRRMQMLAKNVKRIPDEIAFQLAGAVDASKQAMFDVISSVGRIATAPIGSMRFRGRRIGEAVSLALNHIADERRGVALIRALEDPAIARMLEAAIQPQRFRMARAAARAGRLTLPAVAGQKSED